MKSGLGVYSASARDAVQLVADTNARLVLLADTALELSAEIRASCPEILIVGRKWFQYQYIPLDELLAYNYGRDLANQLPVARFPEVDVWQSFNEYLTNDSSIGEWLAAAAFELGFTHRLHQLGKQSCVLNIAVGNGTFLQLDTFRTVLREADFLGYHAYTAPTGTVDLWHTERFSLWVNHYRSYGWRFPPVILTETGTYYPWKHCEQYPSGQCLSLTKEAVGLIYSTINDMMQNLDYVVGGTAFCHHVSGEWDGFNLAEHYDYFLQLFTNLNIVPTKPYCDASKEATTMLKDQFAQEFQEWVDNGGDEEEAFRAYLMARGELPVSRADLDTMVDNMKSHIQELAQIALNLPKP